LALRAGRQTGQRQFRAAAWSGREPGPLHRPQIAVENHAFDL